MVIMLKKTHFNKLVYWFIPLGIKKFLINFILNIKYDHDYKHVSKLCLQNIKFKNIHKGERCFIICNGPSISKQNLLPLKDEIVFSVSSGYHHKDYLTIQPKYHCQPGIEYSEKLTEELYVSWFKEIDCKTGRSELFLRATDEPFIRKHHLFPNRKINYVHLCSDWDESMSKIRDITKKMPRVQAVPIMCLMIAMYMGFKEIYLIGVDLDSFRTGEYKHFHGSTVMVDDVAVDSNGMLRQSLYEEFQINLILWKQFRILKNIAQATGISIFNATDGGALDVFERVNLEEIVND